MAIARLSLMEPLPGQAPEVERVLDELCEWSCQLKGHILGFRFTPIGREHLRGRFTIWETLEDANHAAINQHTAALRSQIRALVSSDEERLYRIEGRVCNVPGLEG